MKPLIYYDSQHTSRILIEILSYHTMKLAPLIPLRLAPRILRLARAKLSEILGCLGNDVFEEFHLDAT